jgi:hypothetical protein
LALSCLSRVASDLDKTTSSPSRVASGLYKTNTEIKTLFMLIDYWMQAHLTFLF